MTAFYDFGWLLLLLLIFPLWIVVALATLSSPRCGSSSHGPGAPSRLYCDNAIRRHPVR